MTSTLPKRLTETLTWIESHNGDVDISTLREECLGLLLSLPGKTPTALRVAKPMLQLEAVAIAIGTEDDQSRVRQMLMSYRLPGCLDYQNFLCAPYDG